MDPTSSTNSNSSLIVTHATVVQTEYEAIILHVIRELIPEWSALVIVTPVANLKSKFQLKIVDPTLSTDL